MDERPLANILDVHDDVFTGHAAQLVEISRLRPALELAWFARCTYCGATSVSQGAYSFDEDEAQMLAEERGWWFDGPNAVCPPCTAKSTGEAQPSATVNEEVGRRG